MKWYYIAIPVGFLLMYFVFSSKSTVLAGSKGATGTGLAADLSAGGGLLSGLSKVTDSIVKAFKGSSSSDSEAT